MYICIYSQNTTGLCYSYAATFAQILGSQGKRFTCQEASTLPWEMETQAQLLKHIRLSNSNTQEPLSMELPDSLRVSEDLGFEGIFLNGMPSGEAAGLQLYHTHIIIHTHTPGTVLSIMMVSHRTNRYP